MRIRLSRPSLVVLLLTGITLLSGCATGDYSHANQHSRHTLTAYANSSWVLTAWTSNGKKSDIPSVPPSLQLGYQGQVSGHAGVNRYFGTVRVSNEKLIWGDKIASTRMAGDPALMASENRYMNDLIDTTDVTVRGDQLIFTGKGVRLVFTRAMP